MHSVSAVGEQYLDLVSTGSTRPVLQLPGRPSPRARCPRRSGRRWTPPTAGWRRCPRRRSAQLLDETAQAVGGLGPALQRLVDATQAIVGDFKTNIADSTTSSRTPGPILDSQVNSGDAIERWARNLNVLGRAAAQQDPALASVLQQAAPTADQLNAVFSDVRDSLPQTLANLEVVIDMLKRYHKGLEQALVFLPQGAADRADRHRAVSTS